MLVVVVLVLSVAVSAVNVVEMVAVLDRLMSAALPVLVLADPVLGVDVCAHRKILLLTGSGEARVNHTHTKIAIFE